MNQFPIGMEMFSAADDDQWKIDSENHQRSNWLVRFYDNEIITSGFELYASKDYVILKISVVNSQCAFDFEVKAVIWISSSTWIHLRYNIC